MSANAPQLIVKHRLLGLLKIAWGGASEEFPCATITAPVFFFLDFGSADVS